MKPFLSLLVFLFLIGTAHIHSQKLTKTEKKIVEAVEINQAEALDFLEAIVNVNSGTFNIDGVREVGHVFESSGEQNNPM